MSGLKKKKVITKINKFRKKAKAALVGIMYIQMDEGWERSSFLSSPS